MIQVAKNPGEVKCWVNGLVGARSGAAHEKKDYASVTSPIDAPPQRFQLRKHPGNIAIELTPSATGQTSSPICLLKLPSPIDSTPRLLKLPTWEETSDIFSKRGI
ncbi:hypothetical protein L2E82_16454 [Cichorium intybus]|uniref:Uncharacterized protein n=1 Tax=Cichorium intybus TaxID=13427 RepID=A0ACB9F5L2_CICIN|nr:hypothetical protein L2E82_16454 [Cichorium intybus]